MYKDDIKEKYVLYVYVEEFDKHVKNAEFSSLEELKDYLNFKCNNFDKYFVRHIIFKTEITVLEDEEILI